MSNEPCFDHRYDRILCVNFSMSIIFHKRVYTFCQKALLKITAVFLMSESKGYDHFKITKILCFRAVGQFRTSEGNGFAF